MFFLENLVFWGEEILLAQFIGETYSDWTYFFSMWLGGLLI